jgi:photosystem II stability/assembly factor-like uncharacterized protein
MLALFALATLAVQAPAPDLRGEIDVVGLVGGAGASPSGDLWVVSRGGRAFVSRDRNETWSEVKIPTREPGRFGLGGDLLAEIDFFDAQRALISGAIGEGSSSALRTTDAGATWSLVELPERLSVWGTALDPAGGLWLTGSTGCVFVTRDSGATFAAVARPFGGRGCKGIFFETPLRGVVATTGGAIRLTEDGGAHWRDVGTAEGKVEELALFGDRLVAVGRGRAGVLRLGQTSAWDALTADGHPVQYAAGGATGLVGVLDDKRVVRFSRELAVE